MGNVVSLNQFLPPKELQVPEEWELLFQDPNARGDIIDTVFNAHKEQLGNDMDNLEVYWSEEEEVYRYVLRDPVTKVRTAHKFDDNFTQLVPISLPRK